MTGSSPSKVRSDRSAWPLYAIIAAFAVMTVAGIVLVSVPLDDRSTMAIRTALRTAMAVAYVIGTITLLRTRLFRR